MLELLLTSASKAGSWRARGSSARMRWSMNEVLVQPIAWPLTSILMAVRIASLIWHSSRGVSGLICSVMAKGLSEYSTAGGSWYCILRPSGAHSVALGVCAQTPGAA